MRAPGNSSAASCSSRSTPGPTATKLPFASHFGHCSGGGIEKPQWWQTSRRLKR